MLKAKIVSLLQKAVGQKSFEPEVFVPENENFGHYSTNVALKLAPIKKQNPLKIAEEIVGLINKTSSKNFFEKIEITAPGFINFWLSQETIAGELKKIIKEKDIYGSSDTRKKKKIIIEFTDPNPFKEFHIGHLYSNIVGEALARLTEGSGAQVKRANYQGDVGLHVAKAIWGMQEGMRTEKVSLAELARKSLAHRIAFMGRAYAHGAKKFEDNKKVKFEVIELNKKIFALDPEIKDLYFKGRKWSLDYFEKIYKRLGTKFDFYYFERDTGEQGLKLVKGNLKRGIFEVSDGAVVFPGEKYGLHRRVFINSEGLPTYEAKELGLAFKKYDDFPYDISMIVTGGEIVDYFKVLIAALAKINPQLGRKVRHIPHGMVRLPHGKMSSRTGEVIRAEDLLDEMVKRVLHILKSSRGKFTAQEKKGVAEKVALGAVKYSLLKSTLGSDIVFNFKTSLSLRGDSGPYLQYTYARLKNVLRKAKAVRQGLRLSSAERPHRKPDFMLLETESEKSAMRQLIYFPEIIERAAEIYETNVIADYLFKLANTLNYFYEKNQILKAEKPLRENRLNLIHAATIVLKNGLRLLGIDAPERM